MSKRRKSSGGLSLSRPKFTGADGGKQRSPRWHVRFKDHTGQWRRLVAYTDHAASKSFGEKLRDLAEHRAAGERPHGNLAKWVDALPDEVREKLLGWGVLDEQATTGSRPLEDHLQDFYDSLLDKGRTVAHADLLRARIRHVLDGCGFTRYADITAIAVEKHLAQRRKEGMSNRTSNFHVKALRQFCRWLVKHRGATSDPLAALELLNPEVDRRRVRRALSDEEMQALLDAAAAGPVREGTPGAERRLIYELVMQTGLRANEIRTLEARAFHLDGDDPHVTVSAEHSKHRKEDVLPLLPETATRIRAHLAKKLPTAPAFHLNRYSAKMLRGDLEAAEIPVEDGCGAVVDFHALRTSFITALARSGVHPKVAQVLARHCTITLTMDVYSKVRPEEARAGVEALRRVAGA